MISSVFYRSLFIIVLFFLISCINNHSQEEDLANYEQLINDYLAENIQDSVNYYSQKIAYIYIKKADLTGCLNLYEDIIKKNGEIVKNEKYLDSLNSIYVDRIVDLTNVWKKEYGENKIPKDPIALLKFLKFYRAKGKWENQHQKDIEVPLKYYRKSYQTLKILKNNYEILLKETYTDSEILNQFLIEFLWVLIRSQNVNEANEVWRFVFENYSSEAVNSMDISNVGITLLKLQLPKIEQFPKNFHPKSYGISDSLKILSTSDLDYLTFSENFLDQKLIDSKESLKKAKSSGLGTEKHIELLAILSLLKAGELINDIPMCDTFLQKASHAKIMLDTAIFLFDSLIITDSVPREKAKYLVKKGQCYGYLNQLSKACLDRQESQDSVFSKEKIEHNIDKGLELMQQALTTLLPQSISNKKGVYGNPDKEILYPETALLEIFSEKAGLLEIYPFNSEKQRIALWEKQLECYEYYFEIEWRLRRGMKEEKDKRRLQRNYWNIKAKAVSLAYDLYKLTNDNKFKRKGFEFSERSKELVLLDKLTAINKTKEKDFKIPSTAYIQDTILAPNQALIEYFQTADFLYIFYIDKDTFSFFKQPIEKEVIKFLVENFRRTFTIHPLTYSNFNVETCFQECIYENTEEREQCFIDWSDEIYQTILSPIAINAEVIKRLIIIPDGALHHLPFEILSDESYKKDTLHYEKFPFLLKKYAISYNHSSTQLEKISNRIKKKEINTKQKIAYFRPESNKSILNFLSPKPARGTILPFFIKSTCSQKTDSLDRLREFPDMDKKVKQYGGHLYPLSKKALKKKLMDCSICQLYGHGITDNLHPDKSGIILQTPSDSIKLEDILWVKDIAALTFNKNNPIMILNNCNSWNGQTALGDGLQSFGKAFYHIGARGMIATLYSSNQNTSNKLIESFYYYHLEKHCSPDIALQQAKLNLLKQYNSPYFWAFSIYFGVPSI